MNLGRLVRRNLTDHPWRSLLTLSAVAVAMFLFCFLRSIVTSLDATVEASSARRIVTASAVSVFRFLPRSYRETLQEMEEIGSVCPFTFFAGVYRDESGFFAQWAVDPEILLDQHPEVLVTPEEREAFVADRRGAIIGARLARKYGWRRGARVPLLGTVFPRVDGEAWMLTVHGIYRSGKANVDEHSLFFHHAYLDEMLEQGLCHGPAGAQSYILEVADGHRPADVAARVDAFFAGGPQRTRTQTESAYHADFINMLGDVPGFIGMVVGAVLVAILFGVVNTMTLAARERTRVVGILKSLGFPDRVPWRLFLLEALALVGPGMVIGVGLALLFEAPTRYLLGGQVPMYAVSTDTVVQAGLVGVALALVSGLLPAWRARRLRPVDALRMEG